MAMRYYAPLPGGGGEPLRPRGVPHALRVGDAERDAAAADLGDHYAAGRLNLDELNQRLDAVFSSKTFGQLLQVMADLPGPRRLPLRTRPVGPDGWWHDGLRYDGPWQVAAPPTPTDRAGRIAAISLLVVAMLIWLFTALLFARHGFGHPVGPYDPYGPQGPFGHYSGQP